MENTGSLNKEQNLKFQRRDWILERVFWVLLLLFVIAGLAGFFGKGGLSNAKVGNINSIEIKYQRFLRFHTPDELHISIAPKMLQNSGKQFKLLISDDFVKSCRLETIYPQPVTMHGTAKGMELLLEAGEITPKGNLNVVIYFRPGKYGSVQNFISVNNSKPVYFKHFIYP